MSFERLQWLFPIAVLAHNGEEAIWMPGWTSQHAALLPLQPPGAVGIRLALLVLTFAAFAVTYLSSRKGPKSFWAYLAFGGIVAMLVNVFVPHLPASLYFSRLHTGSGDGGRGQSSGDELFSSEGHSRWLGWRVEGDGGGGRGSSCSRRHDRALVFAMNFQESHKPRRTQSFTKEAW